MNRCWNAAVCILTAALGCSQMDDAHQKLDGRWLYAPDSTGRGMAEHWYAETYDRSEWTSGTVPKYLDQLGLPGYTGSVWFARNFTVTDTAESLSVVFHGVDDDAEVWVNGLRVGFHAGYDEEFHFDISRALRPGSNLIVVRTDNTGGPGGIYRSVVLSPTREVPRLLRTPYADLQSRQSPEWLREGTIYEVSLRSFSSEGTFRALEERLPALKKLGVTVIWLMPIHPVGVLNRKGSGGSPYSIADYYEISPEYGSSEEFRSLVRSVHGHGMKIILDLVANHTAWDSRLLMDHPEWFTKDEEGAIVSPNADWYDVADLNYDQHELRKYMIDMMKYWIREFDIDGYRCDVAELVPTDFWIRARREMEKVKPIMMLAEGSLPEYHLEAFDMTYAWNTYSALSQVWLGASGPELFHRQYDKEQSRYPRGALRMRFLTNHDKNLYDAPPVEKFGLAGAKAAAVLIRSYPGVPLIFNGEEIGSRQRLDHHERDTIDWRKGGEVRAFYESLAAVRSAHPALRRGDYRPIPVEGAPRVLAFTRSADGDTVMVVINCADQSVRAGLSSLPSGVKEMCDALSGRRLTSKGGRLVVLLKPYESLILVPCEERRE